MLRHFAIWLGDTGFSEWIRFTPGAIQWLQTIHILGLAALIGAAFLLDMRLVGAVRTPDTAAHLRRRFLPSHWAGFAVLLVSGLLLIAGEPGELLFNTTFRWKIAGIVAALVLTLGVRAALSEDAPLSALSKNRRAVLAALGAGSLALWVAIGLAGRFIAYIG